MNGLSFAHSMRPLRTSKFSLENWSISRRITERGTAASDVAQSCALPYRGFIIRQLSQTHSANSRAVAALRRCSASRRIQFCDTADSKGVALRAARQPQATEPSQTSRTAGWLTREKKPLKFLTQHQRITAEIINEANAFNQSNLATLTGYHELQRPRLDYDRRVGSQRRSKPASLCGARCHRPGSAHRPIQA